MNNIAPRFLEKSPDVIAHRLMRKAGNPDGLPEIAAGVILLTFAGLWGLQAMFPPGSTVSRTSDRALFVFMVLLVVPTYGSMWVIKKIRMRLLIGRVGYVKFKPMNRRQLGRVMGIAAVAFVLASVLAYGVGSRSAIPLLGWMLAVNGISCGFLAIVGGQRMRYYVGGGLMGVLGIALTLLRISQNEGMAILFGFMGLYCLVSGSIGLAMLLRMPAEVEGMN